MKIFVNGQEKDGLSEISISELLKAENVQMPDMVSVQLNGNFVSRDDFDTVCIKDNDSVDFLYFMGGGK